MHPVIQKIKDECWDGKDHADVPQDASPLMSTAEGIQAQIDSAPAGVHMIFVLTKELKLKKFVVEK